MKQKDIALIIVIVAISGIVSFLISGRLFASPSDRQQTAEVVDTLTSDFNTPDSKYFNTNAIDPSPVIQIGNNNNQNPFNTK